MGSTRSHFSLHTLEVTNQCVVMCDLRQFTESASPAWQLLRGQQDDVGRAVAATLLEQDVHRIDDFGGVAETFLCDGGVYRDSPPRLKDARAAVFSFTPKRRLVAEGLEMARVTRAAGYRRLVMTLQKHGKFGKVWVLGSVLRHLPGRLLYYEDTASIIDELKACAGSEKVTAAHVLAPGYETYRAVYADRVVTQRQYRQEILLLPAAIR